MRIPITNSYKEEDILIPIDDIELEGELIIPEMATQLVIFSHGSGSSRFSPRNKMIAEELQSKGIGTLLFDLLTSEEDKIPGNRFNINLLTKRLKAATGWVMEHDHIENLNIGYFGASTGAASALNAAAELSNIVKAVVCRGGRPDMSEKLEKVKAPVLLIVGELDTEVISLNKKAFKKLKGEKDLIIVSGATHLFEEYGTLKVVALHSTEWFEDYL
jgi:dienelactone hydrolase